MLFLALPVGILLAAAGIDFLLNRRKVDPGNLWLIAAIAATLVWGGLLWEHFQPSQAFRVDNIHGSTGLDFPLLFVLDEISWPYMMASVTLLLLLLLSGTADINVPTAPQQWEFYLILSAVALVSVSSNGIWPMLFCWTIIDLLNILTRYWLENPHHLSNSMIAQIAFRAIGTLLSAISLAMSMREIQTNTTNFVSPHGGIVLLIACSLRMGIIPLNQPYEEPEPSRIGLSFSLRIVTLVTMLPVLSRVPLNLLAPGMAVPLSIAVGIAGLVGAMGWVLSFDTFHGFSYAALSITCMAFACTLRGQQHSMIVWGISVILTTGVITLYQMSSRLLNLIPILEIICFSGLPYTPNALGWYGLISLPFTGMDLLFIIIPLLLIGGGIKHILSPGKKRFMDLDPSQRFAYILGLIIAIATHVLVSVLNWDTRYAIGLIPASVSTFIGGLTIGILSQRKTVGKRLQNLMSWSKAGADLFWHFTKNVLDLSWLHTPFRAVMGITDHIIISISERLESPGGFSWELLLLAAVLAAVFSGGLH